MRKQTDTRPVNHIEVPYNVVKSSDTSTELEMQLIEKENVVVSPNIKQFKLTEDGTQAVNVEEYHVVGNTIYFTLPNTPNNRYYIEVELADGRVFSSRDDEYIDVVQSLNGAQQLIYPSIKDDVIENVLPEIQLFMVENSDEFKGDKGEPGEKGDPGDVHVTGLEGYVHIQSSGETVNKDSVHRMSNFNVLANTETIDGSDIYLKPGHWLVTLNLKIEPSENVGHRSAYIRINNVNRYTQSFHDEEQHMMRFNMSAVVEIQAGGYLTFVLHHTIGDQTMEVRSGSQSYITLKYLGQSEGVLI